jgi:putative effector of murein hydrolase LrgA (UPF0299 family)
MFISIASINIFMPIKVIKGEQRSLWGAILIIIGLLLGLIPLFAEEWEAKVGLSIMPLIFILMGIAVMLYKPTIETFKEEVIKR